MRETQIVRHNEFGSAGLTPILEKILQRTMKKDVILILEILHENESVTSINLRKEYLKRLGVDNSEKLTARFYYIMTILEKYFIIRKKAREVRIGSEFRDGRNKIEAVYIITKIGDNLYKYYRPLVSEMHRMMLNNNEENP